MGHCSISYHTHCGYAFIDYFTKYKVSFNILFNLMSSDYDRMDYAIVDKNVYPFILYLFFSMLFSSATGAFARKLILSLKLDHKFNFFRVNNEWYYILTNKRYEQKSKAGNKEFDADFIQVDALVKTDKESNMIYSGILHDFYLSKEEGLDKICLVEVYRRKLNDDVRRPISEEVLKETAWDDRYYNMPGDLFVIPYKEILNLNISYYTFSQNTEEQKAATSSE